MTCTKTCITIILIKGIMAGIPNTQMGSRGRMQTEGKMRTKDCRPGVECRLRVKCGLKTVDQG